MTTTRTTDVATASVHPIARGYPRARQVRIVQVPRRRCLAVDGDGPPGEVEFQAAMGAVYQAAYSLHFVLRERGEAGHIAPAEGLWIRRDGVQDWSEGAVAFDPSAWRWTLLIATPDEATPEDIAAAFAIARRRRPSAELGRVEPRWIDEGLVVEAMHVGPYASEPETIARMEAAAASASLAPRGPHHEIYLGDPRRAAPEHLRTVLRQPLVEAVRPAA